MLLDNSAECEEQVQPEVIIDVGQLEDAQPILQLSEESDATRFYTCKTNNFLKAQSWTNLAIMFCIFYNCFIVIILLISFIHSRLAN